MIAWYAVNVMKVLPTPVNCNVGLSCNPQRAGRGGFASITDKLDEQGGQEIQTSEDDKKVGRAEQEDLNAEFEHILIYLSFCLRVH